MEAAEKADSNDVGQKMWNKVRMLVFVAIIGFILGIVFINPFIPKSLPTLVRQVDDSVVLIEVDYYRHNEEYKYEYNGWSGSGVIISKDGLILTAGHVVDFGSLEYANVTVTLKDGTILEVIDSYMISKDITDIGILKVDINGYNLQVANFGTAEIGETVFAIGEPFGFFQTVTSGIVSGLNVDEDFFGKKNLLQTDTPINPGNSGCPLFNMKGEIVAIAVGGISPADGMGFCVPSEVCLAVLDIYNAIKLLESIP